MKLPTCRCASKPSFCACWRRENWSAWDRRKPGAWTCAFSAPPTPSLHEETKAGNFREDLLFRINTVEIHLPPLRDRREDIPLLAQHFLARLRTRYRKQVNGFSAPAMQQMMQYSWPGNVRELEHSIERALLLSSGEEIEPANLSVSGARPGAPSLDNMSIDEMEAMLIRKVLRRCDGNISQAAESLGLSRAALYRRMEKYGL